ncbi:hypothetical protein [Pseudomonas silesiensis]
MTARIGAPKTGGRKRGSIDREARKLLTDKMSADLMWCYGKLGGRTWLLEFAKAQPAEFIRQGLSRLWPAPQKDDPDVVQNNQFNFDTTNTLEVARRVAFALNAGIYAQQDQLEQQREPIEVTPQSINPNQWTPPSDLPDMPPPEPVDDHREWASEPVRSLETLGGSAAEQGRSVPRPTVQPKRTAAELCRSLSRRGRDLM